MTEYWTFGAFAINYKANARDERRGISRREPYPHKHPHHYAALASAVLRGMLTLSIACSRVDALTSPHHALVEVMLRVALSGIRSWLQRHVFRQDGLYCQSKRNQKATKQYRCPAC